MNGKLVAADTAGRVGAMSVRRCWVLYLTVFGLWVSTIVAALVAAVTQHYAGAVMLTAVALAVGRLGRDASDGLQRHPDYV